MLFFLCMDYVGGVNMSLRTANSEEYPEEESQLVGSLLPGAPQRMLVF